MDKKEKDKKIMLYLIKKLGGNIEGKKKLMKLMFLLEHYDFSEGKLTKNYSIGNYFNIYHYGVFSREVQICFDELFSEGKIKNDFPLTTNEDVDLSDIEQNITEKIDKVITKFGDKTGYYLEVETLRMMGIEPSEKEKFFGKNVSELIK